MRQYRRGQSLLEYTLIVTVILIGLIVGGPYLRNAVQGYFRLNEETVKDSFSEEIRQAPPTMGTACTCSIGNAIMPTDPVQIKQTIEGWNKGSCGAGPCKATERYYYRTCTPMNCGQDEGCVTEADCCTPAEPIACGARIQRPSANVTECNQRAILSAKFSGAFSGTCLKSDGSDSLDCSVGERLYRIKCGNGTVENTYLGCQTAPWDDCQPRCWEYPFPNSRPCNTNTNDDSLELDSINAETERRGLVDEVIFRKSDDNHDYTGDLLTVTFSLAEFTAQWPAGNDALGVYHDYGTDIFNTLVTKGYLVDCGQGALRCVSSPAPTEAQLNTLFTGANGAPTGTEVLAFLEKKPPYVESTTYLFKRSLTQAATTDPLTTNLYRVHYTYLTSPDLCDHPLLDGPRYCERLCPAGYAPNSMNENGLAASETCTRMVCTYGYFDNSSVVITPNNTVPADAECSTQNHPSMCPAENLVCGYIAVCFNKMTGAICYQAESANDDPIRSLSNIYQECGEGEFKIISKMAINHTAPEKAYCYKIVPLSSPIASLPTEITCDNDYLFYTVIPCNNN